MSKSKSKSKAENVLETYLTENAEAKALAAKWKQKVVPAIFVICRGDSLEVVGTMLRRSGRSWQHDLDDPLNELYPIKERTRISRRRVRGE